MSPEASLVELHFVKHWNMKVVTMSNTSSMCLKESSWSFLKNRISLRIERICPMSSKFITAGISGGMRPNPLSTHLPFALLHPHCCDVCHRVFRFTFNFLFWITLYSWFVPDSFLVRCLLNFFQICLPERCYLTHQPFYLSSRGKQIWDLQVVAP